MPWRRSAKDSAAHGLYWHATAKSAATMSQRFMVNLKRNKFNLIVQIKIIDIRQFFVFNRDLLFRISNIPLASIYYHRCL